MDFLNVLLNVPDEMERSLNVPARTYVTDTKAMAGTPVDVKEFPNKYLFIADMPGLKSSDIKVQIENENVLTITAERKREEDEGKFLRMERRVGKFMRKFTLPGDADLEKVGASCVEGVLTVTVPKIPPPEPQKPKVITVTGQ